MNEPNFQVGPDQLLAIIGAKEVEIQMLRAKVAELTPKPQVPEKTDPA